MPLPDRATLLDRALGVVVASAAGDALGAPYEVDEAAQAAFAAALGAGARPAVEFRASADWARGEWTDDTAMAVPLLEAVARGDDLGTPAAQGRLARRWLGWVAGGGKGIGFQTARVFQGLADGMGGVAGAGGGESGASDDTAGATDAAWAAAALRASERVHTGAGRSGGNGALMRVGPLALGYLHSAEECAAAARAQARLTHWEDAAGDAAALWALAIRGALLTGRADVRAGLPYLPAARRGLWALRIAEAEAARHPRDVPGAERNNWVVAALMCAWSACRVGGGASFTGESEADSATAGASNIDAAPTDTAPAPPDADAADTPLKRVLETAVLGLGDTDTIAAIAGALAGAVYGAEAVPGAWRTALHGWPGIRADALEQLATEAVDRAIARAQPAAV